MCVRVRQMKLTCPDETDAARLGSISKADVLDCYAAFFKPAGPLRAKLSVQVASQRCVRSILPH